MSRYLPAQATMKQMGMALIVESDKHVLYGRLLPGGRDIAAVHVERSSRSVCLFEIPSPSIGPNDAQEFLENLDLAPFNLRLACSYYLRRRSDLGTLFALKGWPTL